MSPPPPVPANGTRVTCALEDVGTERVLGAITGDPAATVVMSYATGCAARLYLRTPSGRQLIDSLPSHLMGVDGAMIGGRPFVCVTRLATTPGELFDENGKHYQSFNASSAALGCYVRENGLWSFASLPTTSGAQWLMSMDEAGVVTWLRDSKAQLGSFVTTGRPATDGIWHARLTFAAGRASFGSIERVSALPFAEGGPVPEPHVVGQLTAGYVPRTNEVERDVVVPDNFAAGADGVPDRSFYLDFTGPVASVTIASEDGVRQWDSITTSGPLPTFERQGYTDTARTWGLRIRDRDTNAWVTLPVGDGEHHFEVFVADPSAVTPTTAPTAAAPPPAPSPSASASPSLTVRREIVEGTTAPFVGTRIFGPGFRYRAIVERTRGALPIETGVVPS